jgi:hypothetical protein
MHERKKINSYWISRYSVKKVFFKDSLYNQTLKYLRHQRYLGFSKIFFLLNSFLNENYPVCYILKKEKKIVGFAGTIFSKKKYNKKIYLTCNIHSWLVNQNHRIASSLLFREIDKERCLVTVLSALPRLGKTFVKLGFKELEVTYKLILIKKLFSNQIDSKYQMFNNINKINKKLPKKLKRLLTVYSNKNYQKFLFTKERSKSQSFIIGKYVYKKKYLKTFNLIYCSNINFINKNITQFFQILSKKFSVSLCGEYFISSKNAIFKDKYNFFLTKNKKIYLKKKPNSYTFDLLFSETEF